MELAVESTVDNNLEEEQTSFLKSALGNIINNGIDIGIRCLLPDFVEDKIIELKDNLIEYGLKDGISKTVQSVIDTGKSAIGIFTGKFENINQINEAIKSGGIIDSVSDLLDTVLDKVEDTGKVSDTIIDLIKDGKDAILSNVEKNIETSFTDQANNLEYLAKYMENWKEYYNNKDFSGMEKEYKKIKTKLNDLIPMESTISGARQIETLHNLIKNNGQDFNLNEEEIKLAEKLSLQ